MSERRLGLKVGISALAVFGAVYTRNLIDENAAHVSGSQRAVALQKIEYEPYSNPNARLDIERGELRVRATEACNSLPQTRIDRVVRSYTDSETLAEWDDAREAALSGKGTANYAWVAWYNAQANSILIGCLKERNAPEDRYTLDEIERLEIGLKNRP